MEDLVESLGAEDKDNYVYLDSELKPQAKIEITIKWNSLPNKLTLLTLNAESHIKFLKTRITETMEKYSIFSGLKGFEVLNLRCNNMEVPQKGLVKDLLQLGNEVTYDITSQDIWLDMRIECFEISVVISFEIKVDKKLTCSSLKLSILDIINQILKVKGLTFNYAEKDIKLIKAKLKQEVIIAKDARSSMIDKKIAPERLCELQDHQYISSQFNYLDRFIICDIKQCNEGIEGSEFHRRLTINNYTSNIVTTAFDTIKEILPCRGIKIESHNFNKTVVLKVQNNEEGKEIVRNTCCKCTIL